MPDTAVAAAQIETLFTRSAGTYRFARRGRPPLPAVFGADDATRATFKGMIEAVAAQAGHRTAMADSDPGANLFMVCCRDWNESSAIPDRDGLAPDLLPLLSRLKAVHADQYRILRHDKTGAVRAVWVFLRMDTDLNGRPAGTLPLGQSLPVILPWSMAAFTGGSPLVQAPRGGVILRFWNTGLIDAAYDPVLPAAATDASHTLPLAARLPRS